jgi:hypothetical protein
MARCPQSTYVSHRGVRKKARFFASEKIEEPCDRDTSYASTASVLFLGPFLPGVRAVVSMATSLPFTGKGCPCGLLIPDGHGGTPGGACILHQQHSPHRNTKRGTKAEGIGSMNTSACAKNEQAR